MTRRVTTWTLALLALSALFAAACSSGGDDAAQAPNGSEANVAIADADGDTDDADDSDASPTGSVNGDGGDAGATVGSVDRDDSSSVSFVSSAAARTAELEAYEFIMEFSMTGLPETTSPLTFTAEGAIDARNQRMRMTLDMNSLFDAMPGNISDEELELMRALIGDGLIEMLVDGDTAYMSWSLFSTLFGADTKWVSFTDEGSGGDLFEGFGGLSMGQFDSGPDSYLDFFSSLGSLDEAGSDVLRGVETIRFVGVIDLDRAIELAASSAERDELQRQYAELGVTGLGEMPVEIWIDAEGYMRKFTMTFDLSELGAAFDPTGPAEMFMTFEMFNFGEPLTIQLPSPDEVTELDLGGLFGGGF